MTFIASKQRVAKNTIFLYFRTLLLLIIGIFTSRITLQALGVDNYGIVNVVSGFVAMFTIINTSLTGSCQRFITFELGSSCGNVKKVFSASVFIHFALALIIVILAETIGLYFVNQELNLPKNQMYAVQWVYQCSIISFVLNLINIPYNAIIVANEKMKVFAFISILESVLKLTVVLLLLYTSFNKLIFYAILTLCSSLIIRVTFQIYCRKKFGTDVKIERKLDKSLTKEIFGFAGWTFIGNTATILSNQGVNIVLNIFCGVVLNAARGIANMVEGVITGFVNNFTTALNPQITKAYAANEKNQVASLINLGLRISFFLMIILAIPVIVVTPKLLNIWFTQVPEYASIFVRLTLCIALITAIGNPILTLIIASGKIKKYQILAGGMAFLNLPLSYIFLKMGYSPSSVYYISLIIVSFNFFLKLIFAKTKASLDIKPIIFTLFIRFILILSVAGLIAYIFSSIITITNFFMLCIYLGCTASFILISIIFMGCSNSERKQIINTIRNKIK